jgi:hypothetical protein
MSPRCKRLFAWVSLVAILVVHLRLDALASRLSAAGAEEQPRGCCVPKGCCGSEAPQPSGQAPSRNHDDHQGDRPLHSHGCPCCPNEDCSHCCIFCIYAKAPCGPTASAVSTLPADEIVSVVTDLSTLIPTAPVDEFFQPPRI